MQVRPTPRRWRAVVTVVAMLASVVAVSQAGAFTPSVRNETQKFSPGGSNANFGEAVAMSGNFAVIGAAREGPGGRAHALERTTSWAETQLIEPAGIDGADAFGAAVAIDGSTMVVAAHGDDDQGTDAGAVYVLTESGGTWTEEAKLVASDGGAGDVFGKSVSIDGDTLVVGAFRDDDQGTDAGAAYVFTRSGTVWTEQAKLLPVGGNSPDQFGIAVSLDDDTVVIGSNRHDALGNNAGAAWVFVGAGAAWTEEAKLLASDGLAGDKFGRAVTLDGDTVAIGANSADPHAFSSGKAYVFDRVGTTWSETQVIIPPSGLLNDQFGVKLALQDGLLVVGAIQQHDPADPNAGTGRVFVWRRTAGVWYWLEELVPTDVAMSDAFGQSVAIDGTTVLAGADGHDLPANNAGAVYVFEDLEPVASVITPGHAQVIEGDVGSTMVSVPITLNEASDTEITVDWTTFDVPSNPTVAASGSDYVAASGTVTFAPGETVQSVEVEVLGDTLDEPPLLYGEWLGIGWSNASQNATLNGYFFNLSIVIIIDDDPA